MTQRSAASFRRGPSKYNTQARVLVLCEDSKSSKIYLEDASRHFRATTKVEIAHPNCTDPLGIVNAAVRQQGNFDVVYCVVDRDTHANWDRAINMAHGHSKVKLVRSFPCFEFWLLLHFEYTRAGYARAGKDSAAAQVVRDLKKKPGMSKYDKGSIEGLFGSLCGESEDILTTACDRGDRTLHEAAQDGEPNPSTEMQILIRVLRKLGRPVPVR